MFTTTATTMFACQSPAGKRTECKPQLVRQLGDAIDISALDFQSGGKVVSTPPQPSISLYRCGGSGVGITSLPGPLPAPLSSANETSTTLSSANSSSATNSLKRKCKSHSSAGIVSGSINRSGTVVSTSNLRQQLELSRALRTDVSLVPPIRQTASIFKQPVTVVRNHENTKVKQDAKHGNQEKPKQLFWEKRLERLKACHISGEEFDNIGLPKGIRPVGPNVNEQTVLQSLATALHVLNGPVTGQASSKTDLNRNTLAFLNPDQPLMQSIIVSEEDIRRQEERVNGARKKLQEALKA